MAYIIRFRPSAERQVDRLPATVALRIMERIGALSDDPRPHGSKKLSAMQDAYRLRIGDYRVIYRVSDSDKVIWVVRVAHRGRAYE